jgi:hypothetical protein
MLKARLGKEVVLRVENEVGVLDQIARTVAEKGVDIQASTSRRSARGSRGRWRSSIS